MIVTLMILMPAVVGILCLLPVGTKNMFRTAVTGSLISTAVAVYCCIPPLRGETIDTVIWYVDELSAFFLMITAVISMLAVLYSKDYLLVEREEHRLSSKELRSFYFTLLLFIAAMLLTFAVKSAALTWIGIGITTLISAFLVGLYKDEHATEAAWKYIMLCSVGITLALFGIAMLYTASSGVIPGDASLEWPSLVANAANLNPVFMKFAAVFFIIGLGTKAGLAPMHYWLPDAHSQAPSPVSGLMSGVLLNCAMYGIMRFYIISEVVNPGFAKTLLLVFGLLSILVATAFILVSKDIKRMLAYSSVENMGLISIALGIGTPLALFGALFLVLAHSISKPLMFFCSGNMTQAYGTRAMSEIRGVTGKMRFTGLSTTAGALAVAGAPPFPLFTGELILLFAAINSGMYVLAGVLIILLAIIFAGLTRSIFPESIGNTNKKVSERRSVTRKISILALVIGALFVGLFMPASVENVLLDMVTILSGGLP